MLATKKALFDSGYRNILRRIPANCVLSLPGLPEGRSQDRIPDLSGQGNNGTITGATWVREPSGLWVLSFDGDDYVDIGSGTSLETFTQKTVLIWVKFDTTRGRHIYDGGYWSSPFGDLIYSSAGADTASVYLKNTAGVTVSETNISYTPNQWMQIGYTWDGTTVTYIKNGASIGTPDAFTGTLACSAYNLLIGVQTGPTAGTYFIGQIAPLMRILRAGLSVSQIAQIFSQERHLFNI